MQSSSSLRRIPAVLSRLCPAAAAAAPARRFSLYPRSRLGNNCAATVFQSHILREWGQWPMFAPTVSNFSSEANTDGVGSSEIIVEVSQKILQCLGARTAPSNVLLWSFIKNCSSREDIELLFQILQKLRVVRMSNLRLMANYKSYLCRAVSEACVRANALDYGVKTLWKHNVYGLTPDIGSAHSLLLHAKKTNDIKLMGEIMHVLRRNSVPFQSGTADIVFSICYNANNWDLMSKYASRFAKAGVRLRLSSLDIWMELAANRGDAPSIWKIQKLRSESISTLTLGYAFSCAKGYLIEHKPDQAAGIIHLLYQNLPDDKKAGIKDELQKMISQWPRELMKMQEEKDREGRDKILRTDITEMLASLMNLGMTVDVNLEDELTC